MSAIIRTIPFPATAAEPELALAIRWEISPTALLGSAPAAAMVNGEATRLVSAALVWHIRSTSARAELALTLTRNERHTIPLTDLIPVTTTITSDDIHIDATDALHLSLRSGEGGPAILYARTPLLAATLALPGGVYDAPAIAPAPISPR